jgi:hypothetical protein
VLREVGLTGVETGAVGFSDLQFARAEAPRSAARAVSGWVESRK